MRIPRHTWAWLLTIIPFAIVILLALALIAPGAASIHRSTGDTTVYFRAERRVVLSYGTCLDVSWQVEHVREVYINDTPVVGSGTQTVCIDEQTQPTIRIVTPDDAEYEYTLDIDVLLARPEAWAGIFIALLALLAAVYTWGANRLAGWLRPVWNYRGRIVKNTALMAWGVLMAALFMEIGLRVYLTQAASERERISYLYSREKLDKLGAQYIGLPYLNYTLSPDYEGNNGLGFRGPEIELPKPDGVFRIIAAGGSTTYGFFIESEETYPA